MGSLVSRPSSFVIHVKTGDRNKAGTNANVKIRLHDDASHSSKPLELNHVFRNDFQRGSVDTFRVPKETVEQFDDNAQIAHIELWRGDSWFSNSWLVDTITVENCATKSTFVFPIFRWIKKDYHYKIKLLDTCLPQFDEFSEQRQMELEEKRKEYEYKQGFEGAPVQVKDIPEDELFSFDYQWKFAKTIIQLTSRRKKKATLASEEFDSLDDLNSIYDDVFIKPKDLNGWKSDVYFGYQRVAGLHPTIIKLAIEIPDKLPLTDAMIGRLLEGLTLKDAIAKKRLFLCDYQVLEDITTKKYELCHPIGLFFVNKDQDLVPVAIQLFQKPGPSNPIFTPEDLPLLWCLVKMWFNNADSAYHTGLTHVGFVHLMMEGVAIATHRTISQSHPIFKLLAPHFLFNMAINSRALEKMQSDGGNWVEDNLNIGNEGAAELSKIGLNIWRMDVHATLPEDLKNRGLDDPNVLPKYHYREDALDLYEAIKKYVTSYVNCYYSEDSIVQNDQEIQNWAQELVAEPVTKGAGFKGVPGNGEITSIDQLIQIITSIIFTCSVGHAAVNFPQYDEYCHPLNYPGLMRGSPPTSKNENITEKDILKAAANRIQTLETIAQTKIGTTRGTKSLGDFEVQYVYDPKGLEFVEEFRKDLKEISAKIQSRNENRNFAYEYLNPVKVPNSICI